MSAGPRRAGRRPGALPCRHPHADRLAARPRSRGRGLRRPRGGRRRAGHAPGRRADGHQDAGHGRPAGHGRAAPRRRPAARGDADHVRPRRGGRPGDPPGSQRVPAEGRRPRVPARRDPHRACRIRGDRGIRHSRSVRALRRCRASARAARLRGADRARAGDLRARRTRDCPTPRSPAASSSRKRP